MDPALRPGKIVVALVERDLAEPDALRVRLHWALRPHTDHHLAGDSAATPFVFDAPGEQRSLVFVREAHVQHSPPFGDREQLAMTV